MPTCVKGKVMRSLPATLETATPPAADHAADAAPITAMANPATRVTPPVGTDPPPPSSKPPGEQLFLQRDLNEVQLLLDFISDRQDVHIRDIFVQFRSVGSGAGDQEVKTKRGVAYLTQDLSGATGTPLSAY
jgi:hypothetical protein